MVRILDIFILFLTCLVALLPLFADVVVRKKDAPDLNGIQRVTLTGWSTILIAAVLLGVLYYKDVEQDTEQRSQRQLDQAHFDDQLRKISYDDSLREATIRHIDSVELAQARDTILSFSSKTRESAQSQIDSLKRGKQRHANKKYMYEVMGDLFRWKLWDDPNFRKTDAVYLGLEMTDNESLVFANEIKKKLNDSGYTNVNLTSILRFLPPTEELHMSRSPSNAPQINIATLRSLPRKNKSQYLNYLY